MNNMLNHKFPPGSPGPSGIEECKRCGQKRRFLEGQIAYLWPDGTWQAKRPTFCPGAQPKTTAHEIMYGDSLIISDGIKGYFNLK